MDRRQFLEVAVVAPAALVTAWPASMSDAHADVGRKLWGLDQDVRRLVEATASHQFVEFEGWRVLFTGWKADMGSLDMSHQWAMVPVKPFGMFGDSDTSPARCVFCLSMPGGVGFLGRGEMITLGYRWAQLGYGIDPGIYNWENPEEALANAQGVTARLALEAMRGAVDFSVRESVPYCYHRWEDDRWHYEKLSPPSAFYVDPDRYLLERYGLTMETDAGRKVGMDLFHRLYGARRKNS